MITVKSVVERTKMNNDKDLELTVRANISVNIETRIMAPPNLSDQDLDDFIYQKIHEELLPKVKNGLKINFSSLAIEVECFDYGRQDGYNVQ